MARKRRSTGSLKRISRSETGKMQRLTQSGTQERPSNTSIPPIVMGYLDMMSEQEETGRIIESVAIQTRDGVKRVVEGSSARKVITTHAQNITGVSIKFSE